MRQIIRANRRLSVAAGNIEHIIRLAQARDAAPQTAHQFLPLCDRGAQMRGSRRQIAMMQIIRFDSIFDKSPHQRFQNSGIVIPEASGPVAPKGAEKLTVRLKAVKVEGGLPGFAEDEARLKKNLTGSPVSAAALFEAAGRRGERFTLTEPWSLLLLDDARVIHESTPIQPLIEGEGGWRDTLVVTCRAGAFQGD